MGKSVSLHGIIVDMGKIKNVVFDFGGVIIDIDRDKAVRRFKEIGVEEADTYLDLYKQNGIFLEIEDGSITPETFQAKLGAMAGRTLSFEDCVYAWTGYVKGVDACKLEYLSDLRRRGYRVYILSNTNPFMMSWALSKEFTPAGKALSEYADELFLSYQMKMVKPSVEIFQYMMEHAHLQAKETLFVDEGLANVRIAEELGLHTYLPANGEDWRPAIEKMLE